MDYHTPSTHLVKGKDLIGLKVVTLKKGRLIDDVDEIVFDSQTNKVRALVVDRGGWFAEAQIIRFEDIQSIGEDAVMIESDEVVNQASDLQEDITRIMKDDNYLSDNKVMTEDGTELGQIKDIYFDPNTGDVIELEVSQGALKNLQSGTKRVRVADIIEAGVDVTIVSSSVAADFKHQARQQGIQGAATDAKENAPDILDQAKQKMADLGKTIGEKAQSLTEKTQEKVDEMKNDPENKQRLENLKAKAGQAKANLQEKMGQTSSTVSEKVQAGQAELQERKREAAVGKYVTVNILAPDDTVLAKRGEMITNQLLHRAEEVGVVDQVLGNVSAEPLSKNSTGSDNPENIELDLKVRKKETKK